MIVHAAKTPLVSGQRNTIWLRPKAESLNAGFPTQQIQALPGGPELHRNDLPVVVSHSIMKKHIFSLIVAAVAFVMVGGTGPQSIAQDQPLGLPDIKMLAKNGISEDVILSQIRNSHTVYHLSAAEIIDLKDAGVGQRVIDFMINTPSANQGGPVVASPPVAAPNSVVATAPPLPTTMVVTDVGAAPPPPIAETVVVSPGPRYVWVPGYWRWYGHGWGWIGGTWVIPPRRGVVWVGGRWGRRFGRTIWIEGHWR